MPAYIGIEDGWRKFEVSILLQAVRDYVELREKGAIVEGDQVRDEIWAYGDEGSEAKYRPINYQSPKEVRDLVWFLKSPWLDLYSSAIGHKACRIRSRIGLKKGGTKLLSAVELDHYARKEIQNNRF